MSALKDQIDRLTTALVLQRMLENESQLYQVLPLVPKVVNGQLFSSSHMNHMIDSLNVLIHERNLVITK